MIQNGTKSAYPVLDRRWEMGTNQGLELKEFGLTKREMFAITAMQGILANEELRMKMIKDQQADGTTPDNFIAVYAVKQADELLKILDK